MGFTIEHTLKSGTSKNTIYDAAKKKAENKGAKFNGNADKGTAVYKTFLLDATAAWSIDGTKLKIAVTTSNAAFDSIGKKGGEDWLKKKDV